MIKQPAPKGEYSSTLIDKAENDCLAKMRKLEEPDVEPSQLPSTSKRISCLSPAIQHRVQDFNNHMPQLCELSLSGGTVHTDRLLPQIEDLCLSLKKFAPALKKLHLPICSNYVFKVRQYYNILEFCGIISFIRNNHSFPILYIVDLFRAYLSILV